MATVRPKADANASVASPKLPKDIFGVEVSNHELLKLAYDSYLANARLASATTKQRGEVRGGGKKPWRQKGTGRARQGSIRSPQWRGGGIVFGPTPRSYAYKLPKKVYRLALKSVLSQKVLDSALVVVDALSFDAPKTKEFKAVLNNLNVNEKTLVVLDDDNANAALAARNLENVTVMTAKGVNVLDVINNDKLVVVQSALAQVEEVLA